jgi:GNAT superfamily N-acetyltransferase
VAEAVLGFVDGRPVAFAVFFPTYSTFLGAPSLHLEDLYVEPELRGRGFGARMLAHLAALAVARGWARLEWAVLEWNEPALGFYRSLGAAPREGWSVLRLGGEALERLAARGRLRTDVTRPRSSSRSRSSSRRRPCGSSSSS